MIINRMYLLLIMIGLFLSGCSLKDDVANLYTKENPLKAELLLPETISREEPVSINVLLTQNGNQVEEVDSIEFEIWKHGDSQHVTQQPIKNEDGTYGLNNTFDSDGLYYIKIHASHDGSTIMPQAQMVVGELSESELEFLQKDLPVKEEMHEHHH